MHKIHAYPAKFPAFLVNKAMEYADRNDCEVGRIGDIFCGCGTTSLESKLGGIDFWGCDINPVATLIAKVKSRKYNRTKLEAYYSSIVDCFESGETFISDKYRLNPRIQYWFKKQQISDLEKLLFAIRKQVRTRSYQEFFLCSFSNILKPTSMWLTKSIKPQFDPKKKPRKVLDAFADQVKSMIKANDEYKKELHSSSRTEIVTTNFLDYNFNRPFLDMVITSPPYVISYEYADLHQLSTLWLGYATDYRSLSKGSIGTLRGDEKNNVNWDSINTFGRRICERLRLVDTGKSKSVAKYFVDMNRTVVRTYDILNPDGFAVFVIGNTKYKKVNVNNARYIAHCMLDAGFVQVDVAKRKITGKILTPYRDKQGKFSGKKTGNEVYAYEYIVIGKKLNVQ